MLHCYLLSSPFPILQQFSHCANQLFSWRLKTDILQFSEVCSVQKSLCVHITYLSGLPAPSVQLTEFIKLHLHSSSHTVAWKLSRQWAGAIAGLTHLGGFPSLRDHHPLLPDSQWKLKIFLETADFKAFFACFLNFFFFLRWKSKADPCYSTWAGSGICPLHSYLNCKIIKIISMGDMGE